MKKLFGTDGVRGVANQDLTPELALSLGQAHGRWLHQQGRDDQQRPVVVTGKDTRISCDMLEGAYVAGLCSTGVDVLQLGVLPTPAVAWLVQDLKADGGVMISASHNPVADNGLKLFAREGAKLSDEAEAALEALMAQGPSYWVRPTGKDVGYAGVFSHAATRYVNHLKHLIGDRFEGRRVMLDCAHGAACEVAPRLFTELGAEVEVLNGTTDRTDINLRCGATRLSTLQDSFRSRPGMDVGFAFDGDADRCLAVDERGETVDGDQIMLALADDLHSRNELDHNLVVATVMSNMGFEQALARRGIRLVRAAVGDRYVFEAMQTHGAVLGGEQSGHVIQLGYGPSGDGLLTAARLLQVMQRRQQSLSALTGEMQHLPQLLVNVRARNKAGLQQDVEIADAIAAIESQLKDRGRLLVRPSGTEPLVRVMAEGPDEAELQQVVSHLAHLIEQRLGDG